MNRETKGAVSTNSSLSVWPRGEQIAKVVCPSAELSRQCHGAITSVCSVVESSRLWKSVGGSPRSREPTAGETHCAVLQVHLLVGDRMNFRGILRKLTKLTFIIGFCICFCGTAEQWDMTSAPFWKNRTKRPENTAETNVGAAIVPGNVGMNQV